MIERASIYFTACTEPHGNLALEEALMHSVTPGEAILFLWQNRHTVVIGAGQNAWRECRVKLLEEEGGALARRSTGGGAVYHDLGNLNYSIIVPSEDYDVVRQSRVPLEAVRALGVHAERTGRNDLTVDGRKFSGSAFRVTKKNCLQHGTLLLDSDMDMVARYLSVSPDKLKSKGVRSVPSRVINLSEKADVTVERMKQAMADAFCREYAPADIRCADRLELPGLPELKQKYRSWEWNFAASPAGGERLEKRFPWGGVELICTISHGCVESAAAFTDSMDETLKPRLEAVLPGVQWTGEALCGRLMAAGEPDIALWLKDTV